MTGAAASEFEVEGAGDVVTATERVTGASGTEPSVAMGSDVAEGVEDAVSQGVAAPGTAVAGAAAAAGGVAPGDAAVDGAGATAAFC